MKRLRAWTVAPALVAVVSLTGSCSNPRLDTTPLESQIQDELTQGGVAWVVSCPDDVKVEIGGVFMCEARSSQDGQEAVLTLKVTQDDDQGNVSWEPVIGDSDGDPSGGPSEEPGSSPG